MFVDFDIASVGSFFSIVLFFVCAEYLLSWDFGKVSLKKKEQTVIQMPKKFCGDSSPSKMGQNSSWILASFQPLFNNRFSINRNKWVPEFQFWKWHVNCSIVILWEIETFKVWLWRFVSKTIAVIDTIFNQAMHLGK